MTERNRPDGVRHEGAVAELSPGFDRLRADCRRALGREDGPHLLTHHTAGVYDFDLDALDRVAPADAEGLRQDCLRAGRKIVLMLEGANRELREVWTGELIRTVLHGERGACVCDAVVPRQQITAFRLDPLPAGAQPLTAMPGIHGTDVLVGELVTAARQRLSQGSQNPGGWGARKPDLEPPAAENAGAAAEPGPEITGAAAGPLAEACLAAVGPTDLHAIAHVRGNETVFAVDVLDDRRLAHFFTQISTADRRLFYGDFGAVFGVLAGRLNRACAGVLGDRLHRVVLDVQQGALYYYRLGVGEYLFGVTLDQTGVSHCDDLMGRLAADHGIDPTN
jgi:hypothetical protein